MARARAGATAARADQPPHARAVQLARRAPARRSPTLHVHPDDAAARGLRDGDRARISTASGSCDVPVQVTDTIAPGVVSLPHAYGVGERQPATSTADVDPLNGMPILSGFAVELSGPLTS